jgi:APA family basic amino acid/polyamine antiporter
MSVKTKRMSNSEQNNNQLQRSLGLTDGAMLVIGSMIGSGIFIVSADIMRHVGSPGWLLVVWGMTGIMTLIAAVSYGELAGMYPQAGGQYVYLREAYGPLTGFLYGWAFFSVIQTGTIAAVGVGFAKFTAYLIPAFSEKNYLMDLGWFKLSAAQLLSVAMVFLLTWINSRGVQNGRWIQLIFTVTKIASLGILVILGLSIGLNPEVWSQSWGEHAWRFGSWSQENGINVFTIGEEGLMPLLIAIAVASVGSIFSMDAWNGITFVAGEMRNPQRNIGLGLLIGTLTVTVIFLLTNMMYTATLLPEQIAFAKDDRVGIAAAVAFLGPASVSAIALMLMVSTFGCNNGLILSGARVYYTMAKDGVFFKKAAVLNKNNVPGYALWAQGLWAAGLCLTGRYGDLLDYVIFTVLIFYILTIAAIFVLRVRQPELPRPYRAFGYPVLPVLYIALALFICVVLLIYKPLYSWPGLGIVLLGVPMYYWMVNDK